MFTAPLFAEYWLSAHLKPGEQVLWKGRPDPKRVINTRDIIVIPFCLAVGIPVTIILPHNTRTNILLAVIWAVLILYVVIGRFYMRFQEKKHTWYILTDQRALILFLNNDQAVIKENIPFEAMVAVTRSHRNDDIGTVAFETVMDNGPRVTQDKYDLGLQNQVFTSEATAFFDIKDAEELYETINQIRYRNYRHVLGDWSKPEPLRDVDGTFRGPKVDRRAEE